jgi:hypothetical protein
MITAAATRCCVCPSGRVSDNSSKGFKKLLLLAKASKQGLETDTGVYSKHCTGHVVIR